MVVNRHIWALVALVAALVVCFVAYGADPQHTWWLPRCWWHHFTGLRCPSCGSTRALHALLHGHPIEALRHNYFMLVSLPLLAAAAYASLSASATAARIRSWVFQPWVLLSYAALFFIWWIARNLLDL
ncbi:MAG: DUF2752 domain-containing protein [Bacteroidales bacterium]|nr:DUF2752 domain-containing protein [Bacteroidales bacterium]